MDYVESDILHPNPVQPIRCSSLIYGYLREYLIMLSYLTIYIYIYIYIYIDYDSLTNFFLIKFDKICFLIHIKYFFSLFKLYQTFISSIKILLRVLYQKFVKKILSKHNLPYIYISLFQT